ncbi:alcohol dehydrogenase class-3-like [Palaemon carinicauda]|uniref:alcohol dehydrogenase class-3-like n=1 Tax=Palaemon carinicauda TaxID=392227 RepID=UPI0035B68FED
MATTKGQVIRCKAVVAWEKEQPLSIEEIEVEAPKAHEVRIKIIATGVCHTDISGWKGILPYTRFPAVLGHEAAGIVESVGTGVTFCKEGDHVMPIFLPQCQKCQVCKSPDKNICDKFMVPPEKVGFMSDGTTRMTCKGKKLHHFLGTSTYSEYTVVDESQVVKINKDAPLDKVCILSCGVSTGYGAPIKIAKEKPGSTCAVFGLGTVGLGAVMGCRAQGAKRIFGIDINNDKKEIAKTLGVTDFINPKELGKPIHEVLIAETNGGCDSTYECIGNPDLIKSALYACKPVGGQSIVVGVPAQGKTVTFDPYNLLYGRVWTGEFYGGFKPKDDLPGLVEDYMKKKIMLDEFITSTMAIEDIGKSIELVLQGKATKIVLYFKPNFVI